MDWIDSLAELWDRRRWLCLGVGAVLLGGWVVAHKWLPDGFGGEVFKTTHYINVVGPVQWNARLRKDHDSQSAASGDTHRVRES